MENNKIINNESKINIPEKWDIVTHGGINQKSKHYPCDVLIENYLNDKNMWQWRRILPNLKLGKIETGIGDFYKCEKKYSKIVKYENGEAFVNKVEILKKAKVCSLPNETFNVYIF